MTQDAVNSWLQNAARYPLLTASEEIVYAHQVQKGRKEDATPAEKRIGKRAHKRMFVSNLRLVVSIAKKFNGRIKRSGTVSLEDLLQAGCLGLHRGIELFDPERGFKFSTFGYWWCRQAIAREVEYVSQTIRIPATHTGVITKLRFKPEEQTLEQFAEMHGYTMKQINDASRAMDVSNTTSLDRYTSMDASDGSALIDFIADESQSTIDDLDYENAIAQLHQLADPDDLALIQLQHDGGRIKELSGLLGVGIEKGKNEIEAAKIRLRSTVIEHRELVST